MIAARMRECLRLLRWSETDFAEEAGYPVAKAKAWLYGREHPPLVVMAWLETLAKVHRLLPRPSMPPQPAALHSQIGAVIAQAVLEDRSGRTVESRKELVELPKESVMDRSSFTKPVTILTGLGNPTKIESAAEAYALLSDWPSASRTAAHDIARQSLPGRDGGRDRRRDGAGNLRGVRPPQRSSRAADELYGCGRNSRRLDAFAACERTSVNAPFPSPTTGGKVRSLCAGSSILTALPAISASGRRPRRGSGSGR